MKDFVNINFSEELIEQIVNSLDTEGYYCSEAALRLDTIKEFEIEIHRLLDLHGHRYFSLINLAKDKKSPFHILEKSRNFQSIKKEIIKRKLPSYGEDKENFNILRVVTGKGTKGQSLKFHFDSRLLTAIVPIIIPDAEDHNSGHWVGIPNYRKLRSSSAFNILEKFLVQNSLSKKLIPSFVLSHKKKRVLKFIPGNIYFFWGYRALHANLLMDKNFLRAAFLFFYGDPHPNSKLLELVKSIRHHREKIHSEGNG